MWDSASPFTWGQGQVVHPPNYGGYVVDKGNCPVECIFSSDRRLAPKADALLFDVCLTGPREYREVYFLNLLTIKSYIFSRKKIQPKMDVVCL
jgi:hypothetical protein